MDAGIIQNLKLDDVLDAYDTYMIPKSASRKKLSLHLISKQLGANGVGPQLGVSIIHDEALFKRGLLWSRAALLVNREGITQGGDGPGARL